MAGILGTGELALWQRMSGPDRRHAVGVARRVSVALPATDPALDRRAVLAAALLHDAGKVESGLGTLARVPATLIGLAARSRARGRVAVYLDHPARGAPPPARRRVGPADGRLGGGTPPPPGPVDRRTDAGRGPRRGRRRLTAAWEGPAGRGLHGGRPLAGGDGGGGGR